MYCLALTGRPIEVQASQRLTEKNIGWFQGELPTTEGTTIYMPAVINRYASKDENFGFFKVISTHQIGHIEFGSFAFDFSVPSNLFEDLRPLLPGAAELQAAKEDEELIKSVGTSSQVEALQTETSDEAVDPVVVDDGIKPEFLTDMSRFFDLFQ